MYVWLSGRVIQVLREGGRRDSEAEIAEVISHSELSRELISSGCSQPRRKQRLQREGCALWSRLGEGQDKIKGVQSGNLN